MFTVCSSEAQRFTTREEAEAHHVNFFYAVFVEPVKRRFKPRPVRGK